MTKRPPDQSPGSPPDAANDRQDQADPGAPKTEMTVDVTPGDAGQIPEDPRSADRAESTSSQSPSAPEKTRSEVQLPPGEPDADLGGTVDSPSGLSDNTAIEAATLPPPGGVRTVAEGPFGKQTDGSSQRVRYFGEYELIQEIARGGMGVVYKARQTKLNRIVALKMILAGQLASQADVQRFYIEAEAAANLEHPGIVPIYEIGEHDGQHFFSMGFIEGESLDARVKEGPLPPHEAADITKKIAEAIAYAHERKVIHRDLKPANILIDADGQPKVTDFGLAKNYEGDSGLTATGQVLGTPSYMPPEQAAGETDRVGPAADVYSIGGVLYALLTGRPPFETASVVDTLVAVLEQEPVPVCRLNAMIHVDLETICLKCLNKNQEFRYQSAKELALELNRFLIGEPIQAKASTLLSRTWSTVLSETRHTEVMAMWSRVWKWHAALLCLLFVMTNILQLNDSASGIVVALWIPGFASIIFVMWHFRFRKGVPLTPIEKQLGQVWMMFVVTAILTGAINHLMHLDTLKLLPLVVLECGLAFCCMAAILGGSFYPIGIACFAVAVIMTIAPTIGPAIFGVSFAIGLLVPSLKFSRAARKKSG